MTEYCGYCDEPITKEEIEKYGIVYFIDADYEILCKYHVEQMDRLGYVELDNT